MGHILEEHGKTIFAGQAQKDGYESTKELYKPHNWRPKKTTVDHLNGCRKKGRENDEDAYVYSSVESAEPKVLLSSLLRKVIFYLFIKRTNKCHGKEIETLIPWRFLSLQRGGSGLFESISPWGKPSTNDWQELVPSGPTFLPFWIVLYAVSKMFRCPNYLNILLQINYIAGKILIPQKS